jgi:hypothetical protein
LAACASRQTLVPRRQGIAIGTATLQVSSMMHQSRACTRDSAGLSTCTHHDAGLGSDGRHGAVPLGDLPETLGAILDTYVSSEGARHLGALITLGLAHLGTAVLATGGQVSLLDPLIVAVCRVRPTQVTLELQSTGCSRVALCIFVRGQARSGSISVEQGSGPSRS